MFDTHCHLNFSAFKKNLDEIVAAARRAGVTRFVVPGTDVKRSRKAVKVAETYEDVCAAVGIHPHHVYGYAVESSPSVASDATTEGQVEVRNPDRDLENVKSQVESDLREIEEMLRNDKVVAVGEVGMDRHPYQQTKYESYEVDERFINLQKDIFGRQIQLAIKHKKSLIIHNREAKADLLPILKKTWNNQLRGRTVFHCCEPDQELHEFAKARGIYLGVDGDITFYEEKQRFWKEITNFGRDLSMLVLETDAPFLLPEPYRTQRLFPNTPARLVHVVDFLSKLLGVDSKKIIDETTQNAHQLFGTEPRL